MKRFFGIFILFFVLILAGQNYTSAMEKDYIEEGNFLLQNIENNKNPELNSSYLKSALYNFYVASKSSPPPTGALVGLGRVYMQMDKYDDAKNALFEAYSIDKYNDYETALKYYKNAYELGFKDTGRLLDMIMKCYNKLGDEQGLSELQQ